MQKFLPIAVIVIVSLVLWFSITSKGNKNSEQTASNNVQAATSGDNGNNPGNIGSVGQAADNANTDNESQDADNQDGLDEFDDRPAIEKYKNADEALAALKEAAGIYDDLVLDQFTLPAESCSWCESVYASVKELMLSPDIKDDQKAFYAEVLAISGRTENLKALVDAAKNAENPDQASIYTDALELAVGNDNVINFLRDQLADSNSTIKEASVAALTNQGSRNSVESLYNFSVAQGNPDGFYELGIGVGEMIPDEESWPFLQQKALQKDTYSHLAVKALLNTGLDGLKMVSDLYGNNDNPEFIAKVLEQSTDHVAFDDETIEYLKAAAANPRNPVLGEWYNKLLKEYEASEQEILQGAEEEEEVPFTPIDQQAAQEDEE